MEFDRRNPCFAKNSLLFASPHRTGKARLCVAKDQNQCGKNSSEKPLSLGNSAQSSLSRGTLYLAVHRQNSFRKSIEVCRGADDVRIATEEVARRLRGY